MGLTARTTEALASADLPGSIRLEEFDLQDFEIGWGVDFEHRGVELEIRSISLVNVGPRITAWDFNDNATTLTIESPNIGDTNIIERALRFGPDTTWEFVASFSSSGRTTTISVPPGHKLPAAFYRARRP